MNIQENVCVPDNKMELHLELINDLIHWWDPTKSGVVFSLSLLLLLSLVAYSVISVVSYMLLALLCVTITFRTYKSVVQAVELIEKDVTTPLHKHSIYIHKRNNKQLCKNHYFEHI
uniref:Reticulon n=1 Tax=Poecilia mexicana TaxID=48701 RepID=A0A3B3XHK7_9TELE